MDNSANNFFSELLFDIKQQFSKSPVCKKQKELKQEWNYAVCATPIEKNKGVIFGINWGGSNKPPQTIMPTGEGIIKYHFIKQNRHYLEKHWGLDISLVNFNYTNLCFFRTPKEKYLSEDDYKLSLPLFEKYIRYINPPWLLSIGGNNLKILDKFKVVKNIKQHFDEQFKFKGHSGQLWDWNVYSVPHPNAHLSSEARESIWKDVTREMKIATNR